MGYVKMPEMLSPELIKALAGNVYTAKDEPSPKDEMAAAWKEYLKEDKKEDKK
jgi:mono/diheme cytochrome c family protein